MNNYQLIKFKDNDFELDVNVSPEENTIWLTQEQIALLFGKSRSTITEHIRNIFDEGELSQMTSVGNSDKTTHRPAKLYNLEVVISVGYRVKSQRGILFRRWATNVLRQYLIKGYVIDSNRVTISKDNFIKLETDVQNIKEEIKDIKEKVFIEPVKERLFYDGEYFDAHEFVNKLIQATKEEIIVIDPYIDIDGLSLLKNANKDVRKTVCTSNKAKIYEKDIEIFSKQYGEITIIKSELFHDRFMIIDGKECYSLGTSFNYMGKRVFAVIKIEDECIIKALINKINA